MPVAGDPQRLQQVVWNLLSNAIKFTPRGGRVQVRLARVNSHVEMTVSDTGEGIDPSSSRYLFERFRQADAHFHAQPRRARARPRDQPAPRRSCMAARIQAMSPGKGRGTTVRVELPLMIVHDGASSTNRSGPSDD